jgi:DNA ligase (NAD+)
MNIDKVGDRLIEHLVDHGLIKCFSDFYKITADQLQSLERQGEKSASNIIKSIEKSKNPTLNRFSYSLGIRFIGDQTAKLLADHFVNIKNLLNANEVDLLQIPEIGPKVAKSIISWISNRECIKEIHELEQMGIKISNPMRSVSGPLSGLSFLITGTLPIHRDEVKTLIESKGGKILSSVSSKLNYLVVGNDPGSKVEKAERLGVKVISWDELNGLIG